MITVVIPSFERPKFLEDNLSSLAVQSYKEFSVLVIDDCSACVDDIERIVNAYSNVLNIRLLKKAVRRGVQHSRNLGLTEAKTDYIAFIDDDDFYEPCALECMQAVIEQHQPTLAYGLAKVVNDTGLATGEVIGEALSANVKRQILERCFIPSPTVLVQREAALAVSGFDERFPSCQDWDMWTRLVFHDNSRLHFVPNVLSNYRKHNSVSIGRSPRSKLGYKLYYRKHLYRFVRNSRLSLIIRAVRRCI